MKVAMHSVVFSLAALLLGAASAENQQREQVKAAGLDVVAYDQLVKELAASKTDAFVLLRAARFQHILDF